MGVELEALGKLGQGGIAFQRRECDLGLEGGGVIPTGTTGHGGSGEVSERSLRKPACLQSMLSEQPGPLLVMRTMTSMRTRHHWAVRRLAVLPLYAILCAACGHGDVTSTPAVLVEERTMRGDTVVVTHISGQEWRGDGELNEEMRIGGSDTADEYMFGRIIAMAARGEGPLYMYDDQFHQLRMYDGNGLYVRQVGRVGRGPGEYQHIIGLTVLSDGRLAAWDAGQNRINLFSAAGDRLNEFQLLLGGGLFTAKVFTTDTADNFLVLTLSGGRLRTLRVDSTGTIVDSIPFPRGQPFLGTSRVHASLERHLHHHGFYIWGNSDRYVIHSRTPDGRPLQLERRVAATPFGVDERAKYQAGLDSNARRLRDDERQRGAYESVPDVRPFFLDIRVNTDGTTWVLRSASDSTPDFFDVFSAAGSYLGAVSVPRDATIEIFDGEHLWGTVKDEDGVETIVRWRLALR